MTESDKQREALQKKFIACITEHQAVVRELREKCEQADKRGFDIKAERDQVNIN